MEWHGKCWKTILYPCVGRGAWVSVSVMLYSIQTILYNFHRIEFDFDAIPVFLYIAASSSYKRIVTDSFVVGWNFIRTVTEYNDDDDGDDDSYICIDSKQIPAITNSNRLATSLLRATSYTHSNAMPDIIEHQWDTLYCPPLFNCTMHKVQIEEERESHGIWEQSRAEKKIECRNASTYRYSSVFGVGIRCSEGRAHNKPPVDRLLDIVDRSAHWSQNEILSLWTA